MPDIELVIKIPERIHYGIEKGITVNGSKASQILIDAVKNGTPLPKGHGRLIDENKITKCEQIGLVMKNGNVTSCLITDAPTIIEADKEQKDGNNN